MKCLLVSDLHYTLKQFDWTLEVAGEFDAIHTVERAQRVGSVDHIIPARQVRPWVIEALERGMARAG